MSNKLTLEDKKLINEYVTGETKRCLAIVSRIVEKCEADEDSSFMDIFSDFKWVAIKEIIEGSPYIEFHPELLKRIPK